MNRLNIPNSAIQATLHGKVERLRKKKDASVHMISVPTPILLDGDLPISPNRTNYFPTPQLMLASSVARRLETEGIPWNVEFDDYKSVPNMDRWDELLIEYGEFQYGDRKISKCAVGDGMTRLKTELADADVVCITANFTLETRSVVEAIKGLRKLDPNKLIIVGGRDAMARPDYYTRMGADLIANGDADYSLPELLSRVYHGKDLSGLLRENILTNIDGRIRLDGLPFMRFDFLKNSIKRYCESGGGQFLPSIMAKGGVSYFETSRGCFRECDFCTERLTQRSEMSLQRFKDEIIWLRANGVRCVMLSDDNILQRLNHAQRGEAELIEMFEFLREMEMIWEFPVGVEIGRLMQKDGGGIHDELLDLMFWNNDKPDDFMGLFRGLIPFENALSIPESGVDKMALKKMRSSDENTQLLARLVEAGVPQLNLAVMVGFPSDTPETVATTKRNLNALMEMRDDLVDNSDLTIQSHINFSVFTATPFPGTPYFDEVLESGRMAYDIEEHPELWNLYTSVVRGDTFQAEQNTENRRELISSGRSRQVDGKVRLHLASKYTDAMPERTGHSTIAQSESRKHLESVGA